ncbi:hypothetical protein FrEUN1fDRAFT_1261 [Parafrankia sp. EUN1f]|nr:hypothetical protein FrEUN1fDRAFT_1261 [Parafrankia sp. EUN1f]
MLTSQIGVTSTGSGLNGNEPSPEVCVAVVAGGVVDVAEVVGRRVVVAVERGVVVLPEVVEIAVGVDAGLVVGFGSGWSGLAEALGVGVGTPGVLGSDVSSSEVSVPFVGVAAVVCGVSGTNGSS